MSKMTESKKRDFVSQLIVILEQNRELLADKGFDPTAKITQLQTELEAADNAEGKQLEAMAAAKDATKLANETLDDTPMVRRQWIWLQACLVKRITWCLRSKRIRNKGHSKKKDPVTE